MRILALCLILLITTPVFADVTISVTLTDEEYKAFVWQVASPQEWVEHAVKNKVKKCMERMLLLLSDKRVDVITEVEKSTLIKDSTLKTRVERDNERLRDR